MAVTTTAVVAVPRKISSRHRPLSPVMSFSSSSSSSSLTKTNNDDNLPENSTDKDDSSNGGNHQLIPFAVSAKIEGAESQIATVTLRPGETLRAESGSMLFMTSGIEMATTLQGSSAFARFLTGQNLFLTDFTYNGDKGQGTVALGTDFPSKIVRLSLEDHGGSLIAQRGAYLASNPSVDIQAEFTKTMSAGFFGGQGFILQRLSGEGDVLVKAGGTLVTMDLEEGEVLRVSSGSIVAFEPTVSYDIQMMPGIKNVMFGGEGLFVTTLQGPGKIWLQGMPPDRMIAEIASRVPAGGLGMGPIIPIGGGGSGGSSDEGAAGDQTADSAIPAGGVGDVAGTEQSAAASDASIEGDRQATVATSGMMDDDYSDPTFSNTTSPSESNETMSSETTFMDDGTSFSTSSEPAFDDDTAFSNNDAIDQSAAQQQDFYGDDGNTEIFDTGGAAEDAGEAASEGASSILSTLWDMFMGDD
jgi:uncharacterized protein (TIGR00266 family)